MFGKLNLTLDEWMKRIVEWRKAKGFSTSWDEYPTKAILVVSELCEALEEHRALEPDMKHFAEELADAEIRLLDIAGSYGIDLDAAMTEKMQANWGRPQKHGKRY